MALKSLCVASIVAAIASMREETALYRDSLPTDATVWSQFWLELTWFALSRSHHVFYIMIVVAVMANANMLAVVYDSFIIITNLRTLLGQHCPPFSPPPYSLHISLYPHLPFSLVTDTFRFMLTCAISMTSKCNNIIRYALALFMWGAISKGAYPSKRFVDYVGFYAVAVLVIKYAARIASKFIVFKDNGQRAFADDLGITMRSGCDGLSELSCSAGNKPDNCHWIDEACVQLPSFQTDLVPDALLILSIFVHRVGQTRLGMWAPKEDGDNSNEGAEGREDEDGRVAVLLAEAESSLQDSEHSQASANGNGSNGATSLPEIDRVEDDGSPLADSNTSAPKIGKDYYAASFSIQCLALVVSILGYGPGFSTVKEQSVASPSAIVLENVVPVAFVLYLVFQLVLIILDRVLYMVLSTRWKMYFHLVIVILIHVLVFIVLPRQTKKTFDENKVVQIWYLMQCVYLFVSAAQVKAGFQTKGARDIAAQHNMETINNRLLQAKVSTVVYYNIPFLYEARSVLDWACTTTALSLTQWLKMEGIRKDLIQTHLNRLAEGKAGRNIGTKQGRCAKCVGILIFVVVVCIILFPLVLMSVAQQNSKPLPPTRAELSLQLATFEPLYVMDDIPVPINKFDNTVYNWMEARQYLIPGLSADNVHVTTLGTESKSVWPI